MWLDQDQLGMYLVPKLAFQDQTYQIPLCITYHLPLEERFFQFSLRGYNGLGGIFS